MIGRAETTWFWHGICVIKPVAFETLSYERQQWANLSFEWTSSKGKD